MYIQWQPNCSMRTDGRTDGRKKNTKLIADFRTFANALNLSILLRQCIFVFHITVRIILPIVFLMEANTVLCEVRTKYFYRWKMLISVAVLYHRRLVAGRLTRRHGFDPRSVHVRFDVDKVAVGQAFSQYFSFPCQYHSTNAPYSFIHLPPTLYNVFLPVLQFPPSVSFHQCSTLIHPSTTHAV